MAVNYTLGQAYDKIVEGTDIEAIADISRRFPLVTIACAKLADKQDVCSKLFNSLPAYLTARKVEKGMRGPVDVDEVEDAADEVEEEKPAPKKRGRKPATKEEPEPEAEADGDDEPEGGKYDGMNAMQLFKECKKRGIKAAPKKPAKFYIELLEKADEAGNSSSDDDDDEDWDI